MANPLAMFGSVGADAAARARHGSRGRGRRIGDRPALEAGLRTPDLGRRASTDGGRRRGPSSQASEKGAETWTNADFIWMNGEFVPWEDAKVHVLTHALHYGTGRLRGHPRLRDRARHRRLPPPRPPRPAAPLGRALLHGPPFTLEELREATHELIVRNGLRSCYIRPLVFRGYGEMGLNPLDNPVDVTIAVWEWGAYLGEEGKRNGIRGKVSSWRRISPDSLIPQAKATGQYLNSVLAKSRPQGRLRRGDPARRQRATSARAPARTSSWSATADRHARRSRVASSTASPQVGDPDRRATSASRSSSATSRARELYLADEVFLTGTAAEIVPVREIDDHRARRARADHPRDPGARSTTRSRAARRVPGVARLRPVPSQA